MIKVKMTKELLERLFCLQDGIKINSVYMDDRNEIVEILFEGELPDHDTGGIVDGLLIGEKVSSRVELI